MLNANVVTVQILDMLCPKAKHWITGSYRLKEMVIIQPLRMVYPQQHTLDGHGDFKFDVHSAIYRGICALSNGLEELIPENDLAHMVILCDETAGFA